MSYYLKSTGTYFFSSTGTVKRTDGGLGTRDVSYHTDTINVGIDRVKSGEEPKSTDVIGIDIGLPEQDERLLRLYLRPVTAYRLYRALEKVLVFEDVRESNRVYSEL